ncbi:MAG: AAA family ATPase, partial [Calditrichaeota bacterium]
MITREMTEELLQATREFPVVTVFGPRQSGKTTLLKMTFPEKAYQSLEAPDVRLAAQLDPRGFLAMYPDGVILDEIQRAPALLSYIQGIVDEKHEYGHFILSGSHQPELHSAVSQSLAGRTAVLT